MTSRRSNINPVGVTSRQDLFQPITGRNAPNNDKFKSSDNTKENEINEIEQDKSSPLQLERIVGYSSEYVNTVLSSTQEDSLFYRTMGKLICKENLDNSFKQSFFRGHDENISALSISPSGQLLASGQTATTHYKGHAAPIFLWDTTNLCKLSVLKGLTLCVNLVAFSNDEQYICGCGEDSQLYIWEALSSEVIYCNRLSSPATVVTWLSISNQPTASSGAMQYELALGYGNNLYKCSLSYDPTRVQWSMRYTAYSQPPSVSMIRKFTSIISDDTTLYVGTASGELLIYRRDTNVFRASIPVCSHGLISLAIDNSSNVYCGGGDGTIKRLSGYDMTWRVLCEGQMDGSSIRSLSLTSNQKELVISCSSGSLYRCLSTNLIGIQILSSPTSQITSLAISNKKLANPKFVTGSINGEILMWEIGLGEYACIASLRLSKSGAVKSLLFVDNDFIVSGCDDGIIRCHDITLSRQLWVIPSAHRDGVLTLDYFLSDRIDMLVSAGGDGAVRLWKFKTHELITQYTEHKKRVAKVLIDVNQPQRLHSAGIDGTIVSFDLKANRRIVCHLLNNGVIYDMTQRYDNENELITCDNLSRLMTWDIDYPDCIDIMHDPSNLPLKCCKISPSGKYLAVGGDDNLIKIIDINTKQVIAIGQGHSDSIEHIAFTFDERQLISISNDKCFAIWNFFLADDFNNHK